MEENNHNVDKPDIIDKSKYPLRVLLPNFLTVLAVCCGLNAIRFAIDGHMYAAVIMLMLAGFLDGIDGRVARAVQGQSVFGAQLDSLADVINFGVVPALVLYLDVLHNIHAIGWSAAIIFCIASCLRLARFNTHMLEEKKSAWGDNFFIGMPAPAGALLILLPLYMYKTGLIDNSYGLAIFSSIYTVIIAVLMVSELPVYSGKAFKGNFSFQTGFLILLLLASYFGFLLNYFWITLSITSIVYLFSLLMVVLLRKRLEN